MITDQPITDLSQVTPAWLSERLQRAGCLADNQVRTIQFGEQRHTGFHTISSFILLGSGRMAKTQASGGFIMNVSCWPIKI